MLADIGAESFVILGVDADLRALHPLAATGDEGLLPGPRHQAATDVPAVLGGLAGAGSVDLCGQSLGLPAQDTSTVFSGAVAGAGTLVISGEGEQAFDDADLSGVATLKLAAGTMSGSASFGGKDLSLDFAGGALGASLAGIGALSVTGEVVCRPPASAIAARGWKATLVTATAMDAAVQAAFRATRFDVPRGWIGTVSVEPNCVTFDVSAPGLLLIIK